MTPDIDRVSRLIEETAAIEIVPRFRRLASHELREKGPGDLVTVVDEAAEARLSALLAELAPGSVVLGEEAAAADPKLLNRLFDEAAVWIVDPVDGTSNFAEGRPEFAVMVAYVEAGELRAAWIHQPIGGRMAVAAAGAGAWLNGRRLAVAPATEDPGAMSGALLAGFFGRPELGRLLQSRRDRVRAVRSLRCAGLEYMRLAAGETHFLLFSKLMPWDHAPGVLLHREAGGYSSYLEGGAYHPAGIGRSGLLLAPDKASWHVLHERLLGQ